VSVITDESGKAEVNLFFCTPHRHLEEWRYSSILFLTSTLYRCEWSATNPSPFSPGGKSDWWTALAPRDGCVFCDNRPTVLYCHKLWQGNRGIADICFWLEITENCIKLYMWSVYVTLVSLSLVCHYKLTLK